MKTYSVSAGGLRNLLWRSARLSFAITVLLIAIALRLPLRGGEEDEQRTAAWILGYLFLVLVGGTWLAVRSARRAWSTYRLELSEEGLRRIQHRLPEMFIPRSEVSGLDEMPDRGITVRTADSERFIFIPAGLEDYGELKSELCAWAPLSRLSSTSAWMRQWAGIAAAVAMVSWMVATVISENVAFVLPSAFAISVFLLWAFVAAQRSLHLDRRAKVGMWMVIFPILALALKITRMLLVAIRS